MASALALTLLVAISASVLGGSLALLVVLATHGRRFAGALDAVLTAPLVLPPTVLGYYLLTLLGARGVFGGFIERVFGAPLVFTTTAAVIAATVTAFPMILQGLRSALDAVDGTLLEAARTLGATRVQSLVKVALPLASRGIASGVLLGFARACGDFGVTLMLAGNIEHETRTASLAIYDAVLAGRDDDALKLALMLSGIAVIAIALVQWFGQRPHGR
ncbi:MAG: molybdate ABC transporter permease subunit [Archangium sp.]